MGRAIMFSLLGLWEQMKKEKVGLVDGFLVSAITKNRSFAKLLFSFNCTVSFEIIC